MAVSRTKTWVAAETLTASDLNAEFNGILNNGEDLAWPATKAKDLDGQELILDADADTSLTASVDDQIDIRIGGTDVGHWISTGLMVAAGASVAPDGTLHVHTATAGSVTADSAADDLVIENSTGGGLTILTPNNVAGSVVFGDPEDNNVGFIEYDHASNRYRIGANGSEVMRIDSAGQIFIGETVNADVTIGLTINQGASDDQILALKSSDVVHAMTGLAEADTYGAFLKQAGTSGGLRIEGYKDGDGTASLALILVGFLGETADTSDTTSSNGVLVLRGEITDAGTGSQAMADAGNLLTISNASTTRLLIKGDGALHATNITAGSGDLDGVALADSEDDVALVRTHQRTIHNDLGVAISKWDESVNSEANAEILKRLGVLSSTGDFTCLQRMDSLLGGAIWQAHIARSELEQALAETMPAVAARLEEIRAERKLALLN